MGRKKLLHKTFSIVASLSLILQSLLPGLSVLVSPAYAQEATPTAEVTSTPSATTTDTLTSSTDTATATDGPTVTVTPTATVEATSTPSAAIEPIATIEPNPGPTDVSPTITTAPNDEHLAATVVEHAAATSLDLSSVDVTSATLSTDKADYAPTDSAVISGTGFIPNKAYTLEIKSSDPPPVDYSTQITVDGNGSFAYAYQLDGNYRPNYTVNVLDGSTVVASTTFTDAQGVGLNLDQCQNGTLANLGTACAGPTSPKWANGDVNGSNSQYREGDGLPYRLAVTGLDTGTWVIRIQYDFTQGGKFAVDRLTNYKLTQNSNPCYGVSNCVGTSPQSTFVMPGEVAVASQDLTHPALPNGGQLDIAGTGDTVNPVGADSELALWETTLGGSITGPVTGDGNVTQSGLSTGNSSREFKFSVTVGSCPAAGCDLMLGWSGHISSSASNANGGWGSGNGASFITGAPFHMRVMGVDHTNGTSGGNQDRSVQLSAIVSPSTITIHKVVSPNDASPSFGYTTTGGLSPATFSLNDGGSTSYNPAPGSYTVVENDPLPAYSLTGLTCTASGTGTSASGVPGTRTATITIGAGGGGTVDCTYTNTLQQAHLTLVKTVTNDNGGLALTTAWTLAAAGPTPISGVTGNGAVTNVAVNQGAYTLSESGGPSNYTPSTYSCGKNGGAPVVSNSISLVGGDTATCTINNDDNAPALHLRKTVTTDNGGTALNTAWTLTANGALGSPTNLSGSTPVDSDATFKADTYALAESVGPAGYTPGVWDCGVATMPDATHVTVPLGGNVTCTINNDDNSPSLTLVKVVDNNDGGTTLASAWTLTASGPTGFSGPGPSVSNGASFDAGTYALSESAEPSGYTNGTSWVCVGGTQGDGTHVTVALGENATCTIHNTDNTPTLKLTKVVTNNDGGTAQPADYTLSATAANPNDGRNFSGAGDSSIFHNVFGGVDYTLAESPNPGTGYSSTGIWSCPGGTVTGGNVVSIPLGVAVTCTVTNTDNTPTLKLIKVVDNNDGGTVGAHAYTLSATASNPNDGRNFSNLGDVNSFHNVFGGVNYVLAEDPNPGTGYTAGTWSCDGGSLVGSTVTVPLGSAVTCTIHNTDNTPTLKLVKVVINDNRGSATSHGYTLSATTAAGGFTDRNFTNLGDEAAFQNVYAGKDYVLVENPNPGDGYTASSWNCDGGTLVGSTISLSLGATVTCTITNDDISPTLTIVKDAQPNDLIDFPFSGTLGTFNLDDDSGVSGENSDLSNTRLFTNINAGSQTVTETEPNTFWTLQSATCVDGQGQPFLSSLNGTSLTLNLPLASNVTCTFVNFKESPTRTLGFWQTHTIFTTNIFNAPLFSSPGFTAGSMTIGNTTHQKIITNDSSIPPGTTGQAKLFGAFYSSIPKMTVGGNRTPLEKARMQLLQQLVAAKLNCAAFGCAASVQTMITTADAAYAGSSVSAILASASALDAYNNSGDTITIGPAGSATPKTSQSLANKVFWDAP